MFYTGKNRCLLVSFVFLFIMKPLTWTVSRTNLPIYLSSWLGDKVLMWSGLITFSTSRYALFSTHQLEQRWTEMQKKNWRSANRLQIFFFRQVWHDIISVKKVRQTRKTLEISHFEENGDVLSLNGRQVLTACDMNRVPLSNLRL